MESEELDWDGLLGALLELQGLRVMVQAGDRHDERRHMPVLTAFGRLHGGVSTEAGGSELMALSLLSDHSGGNNGVLALRRADFESATRWASNGLTIRYAGLDVGLTAAVGEDAEDES